LKVKVYNVNAGRNPEIMRRSDTLNGYSVFVARTRENISNGLEPAKALEKAVKECIKDNVLKEFLEIYGGDVINMLSMEFNLADAQRVWKKDGIMEGKEKVAEKMLKRGTAMEIVAEDTELSIEQVKEIAKKIKSNNPAMA
jgi:hypothetical protein